MSSGRLDEELSRMSVTAKTIASRSVMLFNEQFPATNEKEGSEIARQIARALLAAGIEVFIVTHLFDLAGSFLPRGWKRRSSCERRGWRAGGEASGSSTVSRCSPSSAEICAIASKAGRPQQRGMSA
ncbi:MAG: P-loop NTPase family protein [Acidimicrobiales bacterium]